MIITEFAAGVRYHVLPPDRGDFATGIVALVHDDRALIVDSGYERHALAVQDKLAAGGARIDTVVLSHEHEDHSHGCRALPGVRVLGAPGFPTGILPDHAVEELADGSDLPFGAHHLEFRVAPGHSHHHFLIRIDDAVLHVGDLLVHTADGRPTPPYIDTGCTPGEHAASLERVMESAPDVVVTGHGMILRGREILACEIASRLHYLARLDATTGPVSLAECLPGDPDLFARHDFHDYNLRHLGRIGD